MAASLLDISDWFDEGVRQSATHMIVVCDIDHEDYPHYVHADDGEDALLIAREQYGHPGEKNMQRVIECYDLRMSKDEQMAKTRVFNW